MDEDEEKEIKSCKPIEKTDRYTKYSVEFTDGTTTEYPVLLGSTPQYAARLPRWEMQIRKMELDNKKKEDADKNRDE